MNRLAGAVLALMLIAIPSSAADYYHLRDYVTTTTGTVVAGASVYVYVPNTTTTVSAYTDLAGSTAVTWPLTTDSNGMFECYIADGNYDIDIDHTGWGVDATWDNYMVGLGSDTLSYTAIDMEGTVSADAFDADDWIAADGEISGGTFQTSGVANLGGGVTTGGTIEVGGTLLVTDQAKLAYDAVEEDYSLRVNPHLVQIEPLVEIYDHVYIYGNVSLLGKDFSSGRLNAQIVETDTLKPRTGSDLYVRSSGGGDDATLHTQFLELDPVDVTLGLPDAELYAKGTFFLGTDDTLRFKNDAGDWGTFGTSYAIPDPDVPVLSLPTTTLNYAYADSHVQKFGVANSGDGILSWESSFLSDWIADAANDTGTVGAGYDSVTVQLMWAQIDSGASLYDTVAVTTSYGNGEVVIHADGKPLVGGGDYVVEPNHPRLFFNEDTIAGLRTKCKSAESAIYQDFIDQIDTYLDASYPISADTQGRRLGWLGFAYQVEQDTVYLAEAVECAQSLFDDYTTTWYGITNVKKGYSMFYDWCYGGMGATRKSLFGDSLGVLHSRAATGANYMTNPSHSQIVVIGPMMYLALALDGDGIADAAASATLDSIYAHTFGDYHMCAILDSIGNDGGSYEGTYGEGTLEGISTLFWLWDYGTDKDPWATSSNVQGWPEYLAYDTGAKSEVTPYTFGFTHSKHADDDSHATGRADKILLARRLAAAYDDSVMTWLEGQYITHTGGSINTYDGWKHLVVMDTLMTATAPNSTPAAYTSAKQFDLGAVFMREGWDLSDASTDIWATYRHEQFPYGHCAADAGNFIVGRGHDLLFIRSGEYDGCDYCVYHPEDCPVEHIHQANYNKHTIAQNAITIKRSGASGDFDGYENSGGQYLGTWDGCGIGVMTVGDYTDSLAASGDRGSITTYAHRADTLTYMKSDLTNAYSSTTVDTVRREFVWMEPDDVFLIFDCVDADSVGYLQKSLLHTINPPVQESDFIWTVSHGDAEATVTFYNADSSQGVGGAGSEFIVNGTNYAPAGSHSDNGAYRIEALAARTAEQRWILTIIEVGASGSSQAGTVTAVAVGDYIGACVNGDTLLFSKYGGEYDYRAQ